MQPSCLSLFQLQAQRLCWHGGAVSAARTLRISDFTTSKRSSSQPSVGHSATKRIAVLHQALDPPVIGGVRKPPKPGGYKDSAADIAYALSKRPSLQAITPIKRPDPEDDAAWSFPDTEAGILLALEQGATHLWANTILFATHPLQTSEAIGRYAEHIYLVGQPPRFVELYDDKQLVNAALRKTGRFTLPTAWTLDDTSEIEKVVQEAKLPYPVVGKPVRGRGSHGVKVCHNDTDLIAHAQALLQESPFIMVEEFLQGEEATVTVMPPGTAAGQNDYIALPVVRRFNHDNGIAPYNGVVAVTANSEAVTKSSDVHYTRIQRECEEVARLLGTTAPIRIDVRRAKDGGPFSMFDVNMKPNMTGPGRPGRDDQASLSLLAAEALGWDFPRLLQETLTTASTIAELRKKEPKLKMER